MQEPVVVVFDLETTGLKPETADVLEVAAEEVVAGPSAATARAFHERCRPPDGLVPERITELTGIASEDVRDAAPPAEVVARFWAWVAACGAGGPLVLVGHNALGFDLRFLQKYGPPPGSAAVVAASATDAASEAMPSPAVQAFGPVHVFDTLMFARHLDGAGPYAKGYKQTQLYNAAFGRPPAGAHTALGDVRALRALCEKRGWMAEAAAACIPKEEGAERYSWARRVL